MNIKHIRVLNYLYYFYVVAQNGSFSKAAEQLFLTQGAISKQIHTLEEILNVKLLNRESRGVTLTPSGFMLLEKITPFIESLPNTIQQVQNHADTNVVSIICTEAVAHYWLAPLMYRFNHDYPEISIHITSNNHVNAELINGFDFGILFGEGDWRHLDATLLFPEIVCPICHSDYPSEDIKDVNDLMKHRLIQLDPELWPWLNWKDWMKSQGYVYQPQKEMLMYNQATLALAACTNRQGIALGWEFMVKDLVKNGMLKKIEQFETQTGKSDFLVRAKNRAYSASAQIFYDWLVSEVQQTSD